MSFKPNTKKKLWIGIGVSIVFIVIILFSGYFTVNKMFSMFTRSFYESSLAEKIIGQGQNGQKDINGQTEQNVAPDTQKEPARNAENAGGEAADNSSEAAKEKKIPSLVLTEEKMKRLENEVSFSDKLAVMSILSKSLPAAEYSELAGMVSGGISSSEAGRAYQILNTSLSQESKNKIKGYYAKYSYLLN